jgi:hypothetical protein
MDETFQTKNSSLQKMGKTRTFFEEEKESEKSLGSSVLD